MAPRINILVSKKKEILRSKQEAEIHEEDKLCIRDVEIMRTYANDLRNVLCSASLMEKKAVLRSFVRRIEVSGTEIDVEYVLPMPPHNVEREVLDIKGFGRASCTIDIFETESQ